MASVRTNTTDERIWELAHMIAYEDCEPQENVATLLREIRGLRRELAKKTAKK